MTNDGACQDKVVVNDDPRPDIKVCVSVWVLAFVWCLGAASYAVRRTIHDAARTQPQEIQIAPPPTHQEGERQVVIPNPQDFDICQQVNQVPQRPLNALQFDPFSPFSLRTQDFERHHARNCQSSQEMLEALEKGHRQWPVETRDLDDLERAQLPSTFIPHQCHIPLLTPDDMCTVLNQFSHILFSGDSLSRHVLDGFYTSLKNAFVWNGMLDDRNATRVEMCRCDGQFSEDDTCRKFKRNYQIIQPSPTSHEFCPNLFHNPPTVGDPFLMRKISPISCPRYDDAYIKYMEDTFQNIDCTDPKYKGMLLILEGGLHFHMKASEYIEQFLEPFLNHTVFESCSRNQKLFIIWQDNGSQNPQLDTVYRHQTAANTLLFNQGMHEYLDQRGLENVPRMNWMNMTKLAQTSDGLHGLMNGRKSDELCLA